MTMTTDETDALPGMGGIRMGVNVDIKRTDGRIHSAVVSGINLETKSVTVEWFERGETKVRIITLLFPCLLVSLRKQSYTVYTICGVLFIFNHLIYPFFLFHPF